MGKNIPRDKKLYKEIKKNVKESVKVWPSAYASGQLVNRYKHKFKEKYGPNINPYLTEKNNKSSLDRWFQEKWVNVCETDSSGNYLECGRSNADLNPEDYPYCRPLYRITSNTPKTVSEFSQQELLRMCKYKRGKEQGVSGKPTRVYHSKQIGGRSELKIVLRELNNQERSQSSKKYKKYAVDLPDGKSVYFGHNQYEDYTLHKDKKRWENYLKRHGSGNQDWTITGIDTAGFWSRWLLWNKPSFIKSIKDIEDRFDFKITNKTKRKS